MRSIQDSHVLALTPPEHEFPLLLLVEPSPSSAAASTPRCYSSKTSSTDVLVLLVALRLLPELALHEAWRFGHEEAVREECGARGARRRWSRTPTCPIPDHSSHIPASASSAVARAPLVVDRIAYHRLPAAVLHQSCRRALPAQPPPLYVRAGPRRSLLPRRRSRANTRGLSTGGPVFKRIGPHLLPATHLHRGLREPHLRSGLRVSRRRSHPA